ncbi:MAG: phage baseplate upper protein, partial [Eubacterium sp.]|nr:phage baseplate upper protein [Eubacterium sp.]
PDGRICVNKSTINADGTITVALTEQVLASAGTVRADISLLDGKAVLSSATFFIMVESSPASEGTLSTDEFLMLIETTNEAIDAIHSMDDAVENVLNGMDEVKAFVGYTDEDILGLCVDYENKKFTRLAGAIGKTAGEDFDCFEMFGGRKRCNVSDDGTITAFYGDEAYSDTGSNGQVMVYQPCFYYKVVPIKFDKNVDGLGYHIRKANYYVSDTPKTGFKRHPAFYDENGNEIDYVLYSAYEGSLYEVSSNSYVHDGVDTSTEFDIHSDLICSVANQKPVTGVHKNLTKANLDLLAQNRGQGWHLETIKMLSANQLLMIIEFGEMNVQDAVGKGVVAFSSNSSYNASSLTGSTSALGNATGEASATINEIAGVETEYTEDGKVAVSYRVVENPWGNLYRFINGINIWGDGTMAGGQPYIADDFDFNASKHTENYKPVGFTLPNGTGYISAMGYGSKDYDWLFIPSEVNGNSALPVGDYTDTTHDVNGYRMIMHFGAWHNNQAAGIFDCICIYGPGGKSNNLGGRLVYIPTAE